MTISKWFGMTVVILFLANGLEAIAQVKTDDCWRCTTRYCSDIADEETCEAVGDCQEFWVEDENNPDVRRRVYRCVNEDNEQAKGKYVNSLQFDECSKTSLGQQGTKLEGLTEKDVFCSTVYECNCDQDHQCAKGKPIGDLNRKTDFVFSILSKTTCVRVVATPPSSTND